jgi:hypothetical protein
MNWYVPRGVLSGFDASALRHPPNRGDKDGIFIAEISLFRFPAVNTRAADIS